MAENKKSFLLYCDQIGMFEKLPDDVAGRLIKHILRYTNDLNPQTDELIVDALFEPIKMQLKRDLIAYESICNRNKKNGAKGGRPKNPKNPVGSLGNPDKPKKADTDNDTDTDNEKDINKYTHSSESEAKTLSHEETFNVFWNHYHESTGKPKTEKAAALKHWKKLNLTDQRKAYTMVKPLSLSNIDKDYLPYARTYLSGRSFDNEFTVDKAKIPAKETYEQTVSRVCVNKRQTF